MKTLILSIAASCFVIASANADKREEITVTGDVVCAHCDLDIKKSCQSAIQTEDAVYLLEGEIAEKFFDENEDVEKATATGTVKEEDDHTVLTASKIEEATD